MSKLNSKNYFDSTDYMSVSLWKKFDKCEVNGLAPFMQPTESMLVSSYVDAYVEGRLDEFVEEHPEIISSRGKTKGQLKYNFRQAQDIIDFIDNDEVFQQFMSGEKQKVMTGEIKGVPFKIMIDSYSEGIAINDLKVMASITDRNGNYIDFISQYNYDVQLACYQEIVRQVTGKKLPCYICVVTKETPINSAIIHIPDEILSQALFRVEETIEHYWEVYKGKVEANGCGICEHCITARKETPIISMYDIMSN